jgi:hypothetical protein
MRVTLKAVLLQEWLDFRGEKIVGANVQTADC